MSTGLEHIWQRATYESYLRRLDARKVLDHYGARNCLEQTNKDGTTEIIHSCLLDRVHPHHSNNDQNPSAACNLDKKTYVCYSLGFGCDLLTLINKLEGKDESEGFASNLTMIGEFLTGSTQEAGVFLADLDKIFSAPTYLPVPIPTYDMSILNGFSHPHPYWDNRKISEVAQEMLRLGYDPQENRIVFPHIFDGHLAGWQKRAIPSMDKTQIPPRPFPWRGTTPEYPKYRSSFGFPKSTTLYNYDEARKDTEVCLVVESPMSVAKAVSYDFTSIVATFGAKVNTNQLRLLYPFERVYVWMDSDPPGRSGAKKLLEGLYRHTSVFHIEPDADKDLADYSSPVEIARKFDSALPAALVLGDWDAEGALST